MVINISSKSNIHAPVGEDEYVRDGLCADEAERRDVHDGGVHGEVHGQAVGQVRRPVDRLHREKHPDNSFDGG